MKEIDWEDWEEVDNDEYVKITGKGMSIEVPVDGDGINMIDVYSFLKEKWLVDSEYRKFRFPVTAHTKEHFTVNEGYNIDDNSMQKIKSSTIEQNGTHWISTIGL